MTKKIKRVRDVMIIYQIEQINIQYVNLQLGRHPF